MAYDVIVLGSGPGARQVEDLYPLSPLQQGMLFRALYAPEEGAYVTHWVGTQAALGQTVQ